MDGEMDRWMDRQKDQSDEIDRWMSRRMDGLMGGQMDGETGR